MRTHGIVAAIGAVLALGSIAGAQAAASPAGYRMEWQARERWMHASQPAEFTPFNTNRLVYVIDLVTDRGPMRELRFTFGPRSMGALTVDAGGGFVNAAASITSPARSSASGRTPVDSANDLRLAMTLVPEQLFMPEMRLWELAGGVRPARPERGQRWTDSLAFQAAYAPYAQSIVGTRTSTIVGDSLVEGRRHWIIRDSALVLYTERYPPGDPGMGGPFERLATGTIRGVSLYDPQWRLLRQRHDTTWLTGTTTLRYIDGRQFITTARFERTRSYRLLDPAAFAAREAELRAARPPVLTSQQARAPLELRLAAGDTALRDSVIRAWDASRDPEERVTLRRAITLFSAGRNSPDFLPRLQAMALRRGDTATVVQDASQGANGGRVPTNAALDLLLPMMEDPGRALALGLTRIEPHQRIITPLLANVPAIQPDTTRWSCQPIAVCQRLAAQWDRRTDERLRDVALVTRFVMDPRRWADTVRARARTRPELLTGALQLMRGVVETRAAGTDSPIPAADATWKTWFQWVSGQDLANPRPSVVTPAWGSLVRFDDAHLSAMRVQALLTGRDFAAELARGHRAATSDSARSVYASMLMGLNAIDLDPDSVARHFTGGTPVERSIAPAEFLYLFARRPDARADSATDAELTTQLLAMHMDGVAAWRFLPGLTSGPATPPRRLGPTAPSYLVTRDIPVGVVTAWSDRMRAVDAAFTPTDAQRPAEVVTVGPVLRIGNFAQLSIRVVTWPPGMTSQTNVVTYYLLRTNDGWVRVYAPQATA